MERTFFKMHGIGNDYIYFDCFEEPLPDPERLAVTLSDRHFSIGGDGIILVEKSGVADARMRMFNADGSEGSMCGNGVRCVGKFLRDIKGIKKETFTVETKGGIRTLALNVRDGKTSSVTVDMGCPVFAPDEIPARFEGDRVVSHPLIVGGTTYRVTCLSMGNPHCVVFCEPDSVDFEKVGPLFERHPAFPSRVNTEFVETPARNELRLRVWERGSGETLACGTGACAAAVAAVLNGFADRESEILVRLRGGDLSVRWEEGGRVLLTGGAELAFRGTVEL